MFKNRFHHLPRYRTIVSALARNSLGFAVDGISGKGKIPKGKVLGTRIRMTLEQLGPTFVKLGQVASTRPDLIPAEIIEELQKLQDHVQPFSFHEVEDLVKYELGAPLSFFFSSFSEEPLASASIGQVHQATLTNGTKVIVKVQRPGIQSTIEADLEILAEWARMTEGRMDWARRYHLRDAIEELSKALLKELDFMEEARNAERMKASNKLSYVCIPEIFWAYTTKKVLTMEYVEGVPFSDQAQLAALHFDRKLLAHRLASAVLTQIFEHGFFHADPHPGNVIALDHNRIAFVDFGMVGKLHNPFKKHLVSFIIALRNQNSKGLIRAISHMGVIPEETDDQKLFQDIDELRQKYYQVPLDQVNLGEAVQDLFHVAHRHHIRIPSEMTMLGKSLLTMEGVAKSIYPEISVMDIAEPFGKKLLLDRMNPYEIGKQALEEVPDLIDLLQELPASFKQLTKVIRKGKLSVEADMPQLDELWTKMDRLINRLSFSIVLLALSIIMSGLIVGAAISGTISPFIGKIPIIEIGFLIAFFMFVWLIFAIFRSGRF